MVEYKCNRHHICCNFLHYDKQNPRKKKKNTLNVDGVKDDKPDYNEQHSLSIISFLAFPRTSVPGLRIVPRTV